LTNGLITEIAETEPKISEAEVVDGRGRTLFPGLIDAHVHIPDQVEEASRQALTLGVTDAAGHVQCRRKSQTDKDD
jgi:imidazolonepropionase-like amidohydrolase